MFYDVNFSAKISYRHDIGGHVGDEPADIPHNIL